MKSVIRKLPTRSKKTKLKPFRKYKKATNRQVLSWFRQGHFRIENVDGVPVIFRQYFHLGKMASLVPYRHTGGGKNNPDGRWYYQLRIYFRGFRKGIYLHKLAWMVANQSLVPKGFHLHHTGTKEHNLPCDIDLLTSLEHEELHELERELEREQERLHELEVQAQRTNPVGHISNGFGGYHRIGGGVSRSPGEDDELYVVNSGATNGSRNGDIDLGDCPF